MNFGFTVINKLPSAAAIMKQVNFGTAKALTMTAKEAQAGEQAALRSKFTIRNNWLEQQTPLGIKITPATPQKLEAEVKTAARFMPLQAKGGDKIPFGPHHIAIPTKNARPNPGARIPEKFLPKNLIATGKAFVETFKNGTMALSVHGLKKAGKFSDVVVMYILVPRAKIKKADVWEGPISKVVNQKLKVNIDREIALAFKTARW